MRKLVPAVNAVFQQRDPIRTVVEAVTDNPTLLARWVREAGKHYAQRIRDWLLSRTTPVSAPQLQPGVWSCWCGATFVKHSHFAVHQARRHACLSPSRHYANGHTCPACLVCFWTVPRLQRHLKTPAGCLMRVALLQPPMSLVELREVEAADQQRLRELRNGQWQRYSVARPAIKVEGPADMPLNELVLDEVANKFRPTGEVIRWVVEYENSHVKEGRRETSKSWWLLLP